MPLQSFRLLTELPLLNLAGEKQVLVSKLALFFTGIVDDFNDYDMLPSPYGVSFSKLRVISAFVLNQRMKKSSGWTRTISLQRFRLLAETALLNVENIRDVIGLYNDIKKYQTPYGDSSSKLYPLRSRCSARVFGTLRRGSSFQTIQRLFYLST